MIDCCLLFRRFVPVWLVCGLAIVTSGCGPSGRPQVKTASVAGTVLVDGQPVEGAQVNFLTKEYAGVATTDASGKFQMEAQPGENTVYIVKYEGVDPNFDETMIAGSDMPGSGPKQLLPPKFSDPEKTELRFTVPDDGTTTADIEVSKN